MLPRTLPRLRTPTDTPGRRYSYHRLIYAGGICVATAYAGPPWVAVVLGVLWWKRRHLFGR